jgi:predicted ester cyclase
LPHLPNPQPNEQVRENIRIARILLKAFAFAEEEPIRQYIDPNSVNHSPHPLSRTREGQQVDQVEEVELQREAFPDQHFSEDLVIAEGDLVYLGWHGTATFSGTLYGKQGTGEYLDVHGADILRFRDGKVVEHWDHFTKPRLEALINLQAWDPEMYQALQEANLI